MPCHAMRCVIIELFDSLELRSQPCASTAHGDLWEKRRCAAVTHVYVPLLAHRGYTRVVSAWDYGGDPSIINRPKQFRFLDFRVEMLFHSIISCFVLSILVVVVSIISFSSILCVCRSLFLLFFVCCVCSILFVLLIVFVRLLVFFVVLSEIELSESKWFLLMKLELLFHSAVVRPFIRPSSYERFGRSPFSSSTFFCKTLLDHERKTCTSQAHWASSSLLARWKSYTRSAHTHKQLKMNGKSCARTIPKSKNRISATPGKISEWMRIEIELRMGNELYRFRCL